MGCNNGKQATPVEVIGTKNKADALQEQVEKVAEPQPSEPLKEQHEGRELVAKRGEPKIRKNQPQVDAMRAKKELAEKKKTYEKSKEKVEALLLKNPSPGSEEHQDIMMRVEELKREKAANEDMEAKLNERFEELFHYDLKDPNDFAEFLITANIGLVRTKYLYNLRKSKETLPRRQEADSARCANNETALVTHDELKAWAKDPTRAIICSISHAWETREHPDPCGYQLDQVVNAVSLYEAAYEAEIWIFYNYTSLYQFERHEEEQVDSFDLSMYNMHLLYAHERTYTFRIDSLTPEDRWEDMMKSEDKLVKVYDPQSRTVMPKKLKDLIANRTAYEARGWCMAEIEWSSTRSHSFQHQKIDRHKDLEESYLKGRVPMSPDDFEDKMLKAKFTHRSDSSQVILLQKKVFHEKADKCEKALFQILPKGELGKLARSLKYYKTLRTLEVLQFECSEDEATLFGKALAEYLAETKTLKTLRIQFGQNGDLIVKALAEGLKENSTLKNLELQRNWLGDEGAKALAEGLKENSTLKNLDLQRNQISDDGAKALAEGLKANSTLKDLDLQRNQISDDGAKALAEGLKENSTLKNLDLQVNQISDDGAKALAEGLKANSTLKDLDLTANQIRPEGAKAIRQLLQSRKMVQVPTSAQEDKEEGEEGTQSSPEEFHLAKPRIKALAAALKKNSSLTNLDLAFKNMGLEGAKALAEALKQNSTLTELCLDNNNIGPEGAKALAQALLQNSSLTYLNLGSSNIGPKANLHKNNIGPEGAKALAEALQQNSSLTRLDLHKNNIGPEGAKALAAALKKNSSLNILNLFANDIGDEGAKALAEALLQNSSLTSLDLVKNNIGPEGAKALAEALLQNSSLMSLDLEWNNIGDEGAKAEAMIEEALERNKSKQQRD